MIIAVLLATCCMFSYNHLNIWQSSLATKASPLHQEQRTSHKEQEDAPVKRDKYLIGVGKADMTGPVVEIDFAGYADVSQTGTGLRQRLYSRAFIFADVNKPEDRFVYLVLDTQSGDTALRYGILEGLQAMGHEYSVYNHHKVAVTGTHSHAGPGAWYNYLLPQIPSRGFSKENY